MSAIGIVWPNPWLPNTEGTKAPRNKGLDVTSLLLPKSWPRDDREYGDCIELVKLFVAQEGHISRKIFIKVSSQKKILSAAKKIPLQFIWSPKYSPKHKLWKGWFSPFHTVALTVYHVQGRTCRCYNGLLSYLSASLCQICLWKLDLICTRPPQLAGVVFQNEPGYHKLSLCKNGHHMGQFRQDGNLVHSVALFWKK